MEYKQVQGMLLCIYNQLIEFHTHTQYAIPLLPPHNLELHVRYNFKESTQIFMGCNFHGFHELEAMGI